HASVADAEQAFGYFVHPGIEFIFDYFPFVVAYVVFHDAESIELTDHTFSSRRSISRLNSPVLAITRSALPSRSDVPTPTHFIPAARAASTPASASSKTRHSSGGTPSLSAVSRNIS